MCILKWRSCSTRKKMEASLFDLKCYCIQNRRYCKIIYLANYSKNGFCKNLTLQTKFKFKKRQRKWCLLIANAWINILTDKFVWNYFRPYNMSNKKIQPLQTGHAVDVDMQWMWTCSGCGHAVHVNMHVDVEMQWMWTCSGRGHGHATFDSKAIIL